MLLESNKIYLLNRHKKMAVAIPNDEIAKHLYLLCVRCKKIGRFVCERCSDRYCSKTCQALDWPVHRKICIPMPSLLEIPSEGQMISMRDQRGGDILTLAYHTNSENQYRPESTNNNGRKNDNLPLVFGGQPVTRPVRQELCAPRYFESTDSGEVQIIDLKQSETDTQPSSPIAIRKSVARSNDAVDIVNLATAIKSDCEDPLTKRVRRMPQKPLNWDEDVPDHIYALERLTLNDSRNWEKAFPLENDSSVTVVHFDASPTANCWVVQNQHKMKRQRLLDEVKICHCNNASAELQTAITNEVYSVRYKDNCYRAVCLYQINTKDVLVRLIDVGLTFQMKISEIKTLDARFKAVMAFALEINLEKSLDLAIGQVLKIKQFTVDADVKIDVKLEPEIKTSQSTDEAIKIETISIPVGVPVELFCLDCSNIDKGYISVCIYDPCKIESINRLSEKIMAHLKTLGLAGTGTYSPNLDEVCFAYQRRDHQWYRAECIGVMDADRFEVIFIDYGITSIVTSANLRKFSPEFSEPSLMHFCNIKGVPTKPTKELAKKISNFFNENPIFPVASVQYNDGMVIIDCPKLLRTIA